MMGSAQKSLQKVRPATGMQQTHIACGKILLGHGGMLYCRAACKRLRQREENQKSSERKQTAER